jgi:hypothetical protein
MKPTWLTLNVDDMKEADAVLQAPTFDRIEHGAVILALTWKSFR